jgi:hypothetical protein
LSQVWAHPLFSCLNRGARCQPKLDLDAEGGEAGVGGWELGVIRVQAAAAAARERERVPCVLDSRLLARSRLLRVYAPRVTSTRVPGGIYRGFIIYWNSATKFPELLRARVTSPHSDSRRL